MATRGPYMLDEPTRAALIDAMRRTMRWSLAAQAAGIGVETLRGWRRRGESGEEPYATLLAQLLQAKAERQAELMSDLDELGTRSWQAKAWLLERTAPEEFGMVSALRPEIEEAQQATSRESRLAQLREHWGRVSPDDEEPDADG